MSFDVYDGKQEFETQDLALLRAGQIDWLKDCQVAEPGGPADGAIRSYPDQGAVNPYFANFAAMALLDDPGGFLLTRRYLDWYLRHLEDDGSIRDYHYQGANERASGPDSEDAYAGTFLSLALRYQLVCPSDSWVGDNLSTLKKVAEVIIRLMDTDGLTYAMAGHRVKYLMDNCEAYRGLDDFAKLLACLGDPQAGYFKTRAANIKGGIEKVLWNKRRQVYLPAQRRLFRSRFDWGKYYPDATCQIFPVLYGLLRPDSLRALHLYREFNRHQPEWTRIHPPDFPWVILAYWAALQGAYERAREKLIFVHEAYVDARAGSWFCAEAAFFVLACSVLVAQLPSGHDFTVRTSRNTDRSR